MVEQRMSSGSRFVSWCCPRGWAVGLLMGVCLLAAGRQLNAATLYVSPQGNDSRTGQTPETALATLQHAADIVVAGDTVLVANGRYRGFNLETGGSQSQPVVFLAAGDSVAITSANSVTSDGINVENADWVVIEGFRVNDMPRNGIRVVLSAHVTVRNNFCSGNYERGIFTGHAENILIEYNECSYSQDEHGIYHSNSGDYPIIRHNICHHNNGCGIHMNGDASMGGDGTISYAEVYGNVIYENGAGGGAGINCDGVNRSVIYNNLLYENHASGITLFRWDGAVGSSENRVFNNTVVNATNGRWCLLVVDGSTDNTVINNVFINRHSYRGSIAIDDASLSGFVSANNILTDRLSVDGDETVISLAEFQQQGAGTGNMVAGALDNLFTDWQSGDFHLAAGSPAVDAGSDAVGDVVTACLDGVGRPQNGTFDVGAYERPATSVILKMVDRSFRPEGPGPRFVNGTVVFSGLKAGDQLMVLTAAGRIVHRHTARGDRLVLESGRLASTATVYAILGADRQLRSQGVMFFGR